MTDTMNAFQEREPDFTSNDPYAVLGMSRTVSQVEIKRAYFALIRKYPPETEAETFKIIRAAYEKIRNAQKRQETDIFLPQAPPAWEPLETSVAYDTTLYPSDVRLLLKQWGDLGRTDFHDDFKEVEL